jgi:hypothetical protein
MSDFRFNTPTPSLNQGQGSIFTLRRYAQSISRMILPLKMTFLEKKFFFEKWSQTGPPPFKASALKESSFRTDKLFLIKFLIFVCITL